jgi:hypothetical protein
MSGRCENVPGCYRGVQISCIRPAEHMDACFAILEDMGCYLHEKETQFVDSPDDWPSDIIMSDIVRHEITAIYDPPGVTSRRQAIMAQKARNSAGQ